MTRMDNERLLNTVRDTLTRAEDAERDANQASLEAARAFRAAGYIKRSLAGIERDLVDQSAAESQTIDSSGFDPTREALLRLKLSQGNILCFKDHTIHQDQLNPEDGSKRLWLACGDEQYAARVFTPDELEAGAQGVWVNEQIDRHRICVAEQLVGELLNEVDVLRRKTE